MATYINIPYGYSIQTWDSGAKTVTVRDADGEELEFDGKDGFLVISGSYDEIEGPLRMTLPECIDSTREWFADWNIEDEVADSIIADLTEWFEEYCISEEEAIRDEIKELKSRIRNRKRDIKRCKNDISSYWKEINKLKKLIDERSTEMCKMDIAVYEMEKQLVELNEKLEGGAK